MAECSINCRPGAIFTPLRDPQSQLRHGGIIKFNMTAKFSAVWPLVHVGKTGDNAPTVQTAGIDLRCIVSTLQS